MTHPTTAYLAAYAIPQHVPADDRLLPLVRGAERRGWVTVTELPNGGPFYVALTEAGRVELARECVE